MKIVQKGFLLTLVLSVIVLVFFYGKLLVHCNTVYFGDSGDALQSYYSALYHITYDKSFFHNSGMNYPYGENVFFTGGHIPVLGFLKIINYIIPVSNYTIGIQPGNAVFHCCMRTKYLFNLPWTWTATHLWFNSGNMHHFSFATDYSPGWNTIVCFLHSFIHLFTYAVLSQAVF